jgi:hypothetical protein
MFSTNMKVAFLFIFQYASMNVFAAVPVLRARGSCNCGGVSLCDGFFHPEDGYCCGTYPRKFFPCNLTCRTRGSGCRLLWKRFVCEQV